MTTGSDSTSQTTSQAQTGKVELIAEGTAGLNRQVFQKDDGRRLTIYRSNAVEIKP